MRAGLIASIPSPSDSEIHLGPIPIRAYALCIILGVVFCVAISERRMRRRGYRAGLVADIAIWAVPFGIVGARLYHVITDNQLYFRPGRDPFRALYIWDGGLGIWGAIALGALGAYIGCRRYHVSLLHLADATAVGLPIAQAIGRFGNYFNQELYGRPSGLPWALHIDLAHRLPAYANVATYQPTFLYESIWDVGTAVLVLLAERYQWFGRLSRGRAFALYVAAYTVGRGWIEYLRIDEAHRFFGLRLNDYTSIILFALAVGYLYAKRGATEADDLLAADAPRDEPVPTADAVSTNVTEIEAPRIETPVATVATADGPAEGAARTTVQEPSPIDRLRRGGG
ncbi:MAG TPA: prolipoprotein diacylglyceryl transferase [Mycobacteriales bacterium]